VLIKSMRRNSTPASDTSSSFGVPDSKPEVGGAGSIETYRLSQDEEG